MVFIAFLAIFLGEFFSIYAEMLGARLYARSSGNFIGGGFLHALPFLLAGSVLLVLGYMLGLKYFHNIWIVSAVSVGAILIVEPFFNYFFIGQMPTIGAGVGFLLGALGILSALFL